MKKILAVLLLLVSGASVWFVLGKPANPVTPTTAISKDQRTQARLSAIKKLINHSLKYNTSIVFLADMKIPSGKNRFFVYDIVRDSILDSGLVAHGSGSETAVYGKLKFSNVPNSLCTSLGKYAVGKSYSGRFGKAYKLYGLDASNSNAFARNIVLHKYDPMPDAVQNGPICNSFGCPMVSAKFYERLQRYIDQSDKPIILDIYY